MELSGSTALVTGANRGLGRHFAQQLLERGARKVYATARTPEAVDLPGVEVLRLDITDQQSVDAVAAAAQDVDVLINNAGISTYQNLVTGDLAEIQRELGTHFYGTLAMVRAFAPILGRNGGGAILNVLSALSWRAYPGAGAYAAAKSAQWSLTNSVRLELAAQRTQVTGVLLGATDTDMMAGWDVPKNDPADIVRISLDGVQSGVLEILADQGARDAKAAVAAGPAEAYPELALS
ncbi:short-chain dehydrogenase/reductase SDR [Kribbella flavida DSM 17836]|uniref:Short-chain dehydrogenase/reductase SDR n=1 Tax=Kribbella flavida (strain DSM 17836 / JCM 10339 / NBRC 14399) TaxID=479435 RepID=D2PPT1_KRIFD|nr:SDR family oxidoreductase [Kribbella flavida]ADB32855.1 short-chain dehydrogenase/reductase SDR [Kribbella flavida DSM 17836]